MAQPQKIINSIANHINKCGRWSLSRFTYNSWLILSDSLLSIDIEEAYTIKALTYYTLLQNHATHSRCALKNETLTKCYNKFQSILSDELKGIIMQTIDYNNQDLEVLKYTQIDRELFLEVMGVAIKTLSEFGNFTIGYRVNARHPNDDLIINIVSEQIDIELMNELNEAWLENILDHETDYEFNQISRLLVNFRPVSNNDGVVYAN